MSTTNVNILALVTAGNLDDLKTEVEANPDLLTQPIRGDGFTLLMYACHPDSGGQPEIAAWLIEQGANLDAQDVYGNTALIFASQNRQVDSAKLLIEHGASLDVKDAIFGFPALMHACQLDQPEIAKSLIEHGANVNTTGVELGWTPLMFACEMASLDTAKLLIEHGADVNAKSEVFQDGYTPLTYAITLRAPPATMELLIENGADVNLPGFSFEFPLAWACLQGDLEIAQLLLDSGSDINAVGPDGKTALIQSCFTFDYKLDMVKLLLQEGAEIDAQDDSQNTALIYLCSSSQVTSSERSEDLLLGGIKQLWAAGAQTDLENSEGQTALSLAEASQMTTAAGFLTFTSSELSQILLGKLGLSRDVVVAFYDAGITTQSSCGSLTESSLEDMGVESSDTAKVLETLKDGSSPRSSLARRVSQRLSQALRLSGP